MSTRRTIQSRLREDVIVTPPNPHTKPQFSTLRSRLCSEEAPQPDPSPEGPSSPDLLGSPEVLSHFRRIFGANVAGSPAALPESENPADALLLFKDSLAHAGAELHSTTVNELVETHDKIAQAIAAHDSQTAASLETVDSLYGNILCPLSATVCSSDELPRATLSEHAERAQKLLAGIRDEVAAVAERLDENARQVADLVAEYEELQGGEEGGAELNSSASADLVKEVEEIYEEQVQELRNIEAEYQKKSKSAMAKIMQDLV